MCSEKRVKMLLGVGFLVYALSQIARHVLVGSATPLVEFTTGLGTGLAIVASIMLVIHMRKKKA